MCTRITLTIPLEDLEIRFDIDEVYFRSENPGYNIAPSQKVATVIREHNENKLIGMQWGLIPSWSKRDPSSNYTLVNARSETLLEKPSFKGLFESKRCLILADGFYEWKTSGKQKFPYYFKLNSKEPFGIAGLFDIIQDNDEEILMCTVITTTANTLVAKVHDRMPVILPQNSEKVWLDGDTTTERLKSILLPFSADQMHSYRVRAKYVNSTTEYNSLECIKPDKTKSLTDFF